jgi:hypothetical protein
VKGAVALEQPESRSEDRSPEYAKPEIVDYGDLQQLTAADLVGTLADVPFGAYTPGFS